MQKQQKLLSQAKEKLNQLQKNPLKTDKTLTSASTPTQIATLQSDLLIDTPTTLNPQEISYRDELASRLKLLMKLPEYGEVSLKLTINRTGKIIQVKVLKSKSSSNQAHVEKILPTLKMPPFGNNFGNKAEYTFTITMSNINT